MSGRQSPDTALMRFVSHRFFSPALFLDIGSGEGANARELRGREGWRHSVITLDKDPKTAPDYCADVCTVPNPPWKFDCIYDINTLCHVENPPFERIKSWLKPEGFFFSICPTALAPKYIEEGKDFTRRVDEIELRQMLNPVFSFVRIEWRGEPDLKIPRSSQLESWIVEARP